jgi:hypothetical protein
VAGTQVEIQGLNKFVATVRRAGIDLAEMKQANARAGAVIVSAANARAPRRSGALAGTIRSARQARKVIVMAGSARVPYAGPIHWGWPARHIAPNPFLSQAAQSTESTWLPGYLSDIDKILAKVQGA